MIQFLNRDAIDIQSYDQCIESSSQNRIYALSWYLDIVADDWGALVFNDYKAVMPIPYMKALKYLNRKKIIQPFLCQQLGIFSKERSLEIEDAFFKSFVEMHPKNYAFNTHNVFNLLDKKVNYELTLNKAYASLKTNYRKDRKYRVNQSKREKFTLTHSNDTSELIYIAKSNYDIKEYNSNFFSTLNNLASEVIKRNKGYIIDVIKDSKVVGAALFLEHNNRIIYLFSAFCSEGKKLQAPSYLLDSIIQDNSDSECILDFEGSSIPEIASFFRSFGAKELTYPVVI